MDLTLGTRSIADRVSSWTVADDEVFSDHKLIKFRIDGSGPKNLVYGVSMLAFFLLIVLFVF